MQRHRKQQRRVDTSAAAAPTSDPCGPLERRADEVLTPLPSAIAIPQRPAPRPAPHPSRLKVAFDDRLVASSSSWSPTRSAREASARSLPKDSDDMSSRTGTARPADQSRRAAARVNRKPLPHAAETGDASFVPFLQRRRAMPVTRSAAVHSVEIGKKRKFSGRASFPGEIRS